MALVATTREYNIWLAGYYDDFSSARAFADDDNTADGRNYVHTKTHFGSPLNGEAFLNPRYRFSYADRAQATGYMDGDLGDASAVGGSAPYFFATTATDETHNLGIDKWLTFDDIRKNANEWEGRSQTQYPDMVVANRYKFNEASLDSYMTFCNGNDTAGQYIIPGGDNDASYGRAMVTSPTAKADGDTLWRNDAGCSVKSSDFSYDKTVIANIGGVLMGERMLPLVADVDSANRYLYPLKSPSGMPFFIHSLYAPTSGTHRIISYDGNLKCRGVGDTFNIRIAVHQEGASDYDNYSLNIGYLSSATYNKSTHAWSTNTAAVTIPLPPSLLGTTMLSYDGASTSHTGDSAGLWTDVDITFNFAAQTWTAYTSASTTAFGTGAFNSRPGGGSWTPAELSGWALDAVCSSGFSGDLRLITCIDRAAVYIPLQDPVGGAVLPPISVFKHKAGTNSLSSFDIEVLDDDNTHALLPLITAEGFADWSLLFFANMQLHRPTWRGIIESISFSQRGDATNLMKLSARDPLTIHNRQLPFWEWGQNADLGYSDHHSMTQNITKQSGAINSLRDALYFGVAKLRTGDPSLGFDYPNAYGELDTQRTQLHSGNPIQFYVNEDEEGPNSIEDEWEGKNSSFTLADIRMIKTEDSGGTVYDSSSSPEIMVYFEAHGSATSNHPRIAINNIITIAGSGDAGIDGAWKCLGNATLVVAQSIDDPNFKTFYQVELTLTGAGRAGSNPTIATNIITGVSTIQPLDRHDSKTIIRVTTSGSHGLALGDTAYFSSQASKPFSGQTHTVYAIISATVFDIHIEGEWSGALTATISTASIDLLDGRKFGHSALGTNDGVSPVLYEGALLADATFMKTKHRNTHARWLRDYTKSNWFKSRFGIISRQAHWVGGIGSGIRNPVSAGFASNYTGGGLGIVGTQDGLNADYATTDATWTFDEPGMWYHIAVKNRPPIIDLIDVNTNEHDVIIAGGNTDPSNCPVAFASASSFTVTGNTSAFFGHFTSVGNAPLLWEVVVHTGFSDERLNGVFQVVGLVSFSAPATRTYVAIKIKEWDNPPTGVNNLMNLYTRVSQASNLDPDMMLPIIELQAYKTLSAYNTYITNGGTNTENVFNYAGLTGSNLRPAWNSNGIGSAAPANETGKQYYGSWNLTGVKGHTRTWNDDETLYRLRKVDESLGYKHLWGLFADMRNNGSADADGSYRKSDFGLMLPTPDNYSIDMFFANQFDENGDLDKFVSLKIGEDIDVWSLDSASEPYSAAPYAHLKLGSDDEPLDTRYHDPETKGGALMLIDASRFFNLNTMATGGRPGYSAGGTAHFDDYETPIAGTPYLIDNYWLEGTGTYKNTNNGATVANHENQLNFINDATSLTDIVAVTETTIQVADITNFASIIAGGATTGYGTILCSKGTGRNTEGVIYSFVWTGTHTANSRLTGVYINGYPDTVVGPKSVRAALDADNGAWAGGSLTAIELNNEELGITDKWDAVTVYNTPAALFAMRMLMAVEGYVVSPNIGTYWEHDKIRVLQSLSLLDNWSRNQYLSSISDINNVPISRNMTVTQTNYNANYFGTGNGDSDSFGCVVDARALTTLGCIQSTASKAGTGYVYTDTQNFSWLCGRDGRLDYRPNYNSQHTFTRNNIKAASLRAGGSRSITNIRVFYRGGTSFVDWPTPTDGTAAKWKVIHSNTVTVKEEALALAKREYSTLKKNQLSVSIEMLPPLTTTSFSGDNSDPMTYNARFGYIADPFRVSLPLALTGSYPAVYGPNGASSWTSRFGGVLFNGQVNALNGNHGISKQPSSMRVTPVLCQTTISDPIPVACIRYGTIVGVAAHTGTASGQIAIGATHSGNYTLKWKIVSTAGSYDASVTFDPAASGWILLDGGSGKKISVYITHGSLPARPGSGTDSYYHLVRYVSSVEPDDAYYFYGANSLSHAMQIVSVPPACPLVSAGTGEDLRFAITIQDTAAGIDDCTFKIWALDYSFSTSGATASSGAAASPLLTPTLSSSSGVVAKGNGFYELPLPSTYDASALGSNDKLVVSFNADYCRALLRNKQGSTTYKNAHNIPGLTTYASFETDSIFPLGVRIFSEYGGYADKRAAWYAPRLHVVDDVNYIPSTNCVITDTHMDLSAQDMVIQSVDWSRKHRETPKVTLSLEIDESNYGYSFVDIARPQPPSNAPPPTSGPIGPLLPPSGGGPQFPPGGGYGGGGVGSGGPIGDEIGPSKPVKPSIGSGDNSSMSYGLGVNALSKGLIRTLNNRTKMPIDETSAGGEWGILGQKRVGKPSAHDTSINGFDCLPETNSGVAVQTTDGFSLPGITNPIDGAAGEMHSHTITVRVPNDARDNMVSLTALVSMSEITSGGTGYIKTIIECVETGASITTNIAIANAAKSTRVLKNLIPVQPLNGAETAGNHLKITLKRYPDGSTDTAIYQTITVHSLSLTTRRNSLPTGGQTASSYKPF